MSILYVFLEYVNHVSAFQVWVRENGKYEQMTTDLIFLYWLKTGFVAIHLIEESGCIRSPTILYVPGLAHPLRDVLSAVESLTLIIDPPYVLSIKEVDEFGAGVVV